MYSLGAMLSFTIAHVSLVVLRYRDRDEELAFKGRPNLRLGGVDGRSPSLGALGTGIAWLVVVVQTPKPAMRGWRGSRSASSSTSPTGGSSCESRCAQR